jgi:hypothetical protein
MSWIGCEETTWWLTRALNDPEVCARLRELRVRGASPAEYAEALTSMLDNDAAQVARAELTELPSLTSSALIEAWAMADVAGKDFKIVSERPARPLEYARKRQVSLAVHTDVDGVTVAISHVAGRHADWYALPRP